MVVRISDRGPGVAEHGESRALDTAYGDTRSVSAGLGLSIARGLAAAQHGSVDYEARAGGGSVFTLFLPLAEPDAP
jgi:K+-sensing histidine kinase KdpD